MQPDNKIVRGVWIGSRLTNMQKLSIQSYLDNGHEFHLYTYGIVEGVPAGATVMEAQTVVPYKKMDDFICRSHFSDYFRVMLINKTGGWYVDVDTVCLKPFDFAADHVFVSEGMFGAMRNPATDTPRAPAETYVSHGKSYDLYHHLNGCIFKAPANSDFLRYIINRIAEMDTKAFVLPEDWIQVGPQLFRDAARMMNYTSFVQPPVTFDGVNPDELYLTVAAGIKWKISPKSYTIHLRSSAWKRGTGLDPDKEYPADSLYEILKKKHNILNHVQPPPLTNATLAEAVRPYTMAANKINLVIDLASRLDAENIPGDVVECGTCNGGAGAVLAHYAALSRFNRKTWLFDSFEGLPEVTKEDLPETATGREAKTVVGQCVGSIENVEEVLGKVGADMDRVNIVKGWFEHTFPTIDIPQIAMLNLDSDWYQCELLCWKKFYDAVAFGGYIYLDDFYYWPGCQQAAKDFFKSRRNEFPQRFSRFEHSAWIKKETQEALSIYWADHKEEMRTMWGRW